MFGFGLACLDWDSNLRTGIRVFGLRLGSWGLDRHGHPPLGQCETASYACSQGQQGPSFAGCTAVRTAARRVSIHTRGLGVDRGGFVVRRVFFFVVWCSRHLFRWTRLKCVKSRGKSRTKSREDEQMDRRLFSCARTAVCSTRLADLSVLGGATRDDLLNKVCVWWSCGIID